MCFMQSIKVTRSWFTGAAKGESWMLECFSWRCGPSRSKVWKLQTDKFSVEIRCRFFDS